jgi:hypothetical protein
MLWLIQLFFPLALLSMLAFRPARAKFTRALQIAGTAGFLLALHLAGLWIMPPWWTPWLLWGLFALVLWHGRTARSRPGFGGGDYLVAMFWAGLLSLGGWVSIEALGARTPPAGEMAILAMPLPAGLYYVANGGSRDILSAHLRTLPRATIGQRNYWGQSYGVDIIATDRRGLIADRAVPVLSPCAGHVVRAHDGETDGGPVDLASPTARAGNFVLVRCGAFDVLLAHFRKGSLRVKPGDVVSPGQPVGALGNSGASDMPHLHIHAQRPGTAAAPFSGQPVPMRLAGRYLVRGDRP